MTSDRVTVGHRPPAGVLPVATAHVADAMDRQGMMRCVTPVGLHPLNPGSTLVGWARGGRVTEGPQDTLATIRRMRPGEVLVIDDEGRRDGACLGDRLAAAAVDHGAAGAVLWGCHRDSAELRRLGIPVFSLGAVPWRARPPRDSTHRPVRLGGTVVADGDLVVADDDGVLVVPAAAAEAVLALAWELVAEETGRLRPAKHLSEVIDSYHED